MVQPRMPLLHACHSSSKAGVALAQRLVRAANHAHLCGAAHEDVEV
jgi:hypothetical protein